MTQSLGYLVREEGDTVSFAEILKHDKLCQSVADAENYAKSLGYKSFSVFEVSISLSKKIV